MSKRSLSRLRTYSKDKKSQTYHLTCRKYALCLGPKPLLFIKYISPMLHATCWFQYSRGQLYKNTALNSKNIVWLWSSLGFKPQYAEHFRPRSCILCDLCSMLHELYFMLFAISFLLYYPFHAKCTLIFGNVLCSNIQSQLFVWCYLFCCECLGPPWTTPAWKRVCSTCSRTLIQTL